ncbi:uncharacterized protein LOC144628407 isoform X1 [Oculina patagonica]
MQVSKGRKIIKKKLLSQAKKFTTMKTAVLLCLVVWLVCVADAKKSDASRDDHDEKNDRKRMDNRVEECTEEEAERKHCLDGATCYTFLLKDSQRYLFCSRGPPVPLEV